MTIRADDIIFQSNHLRAASMALRCDGRKFIKNKLDSVIAEG
jgi:hypothetical protein